MLHIVSLLIYSYTLVIVIHIRSQLKLRVTRDVTDEQFADYLITVHSFLH